MDRRLEIALEIKAETSTWKLIRMFLHFSSNVTVLWQNIGHDAGAYSAAQASFYISYCFCNSMVTQGRARTQSIPRWKGCDH